MHTSILVHRKKGTQFPTDLLQTLLKTTSVIGYCVADPEGYLTTDILQPTEKEFTEADGLFDTCDVIYAFQHSDDTIANEDIQPFILKEKTILNSKKSPVLVPSLVAFMDGSFIGYHDKDSPHSNAKLAFDEWLKPAISDLEEGAKGNFDTLVSLLEGPKFQGNVRNICTPHGTVLFFAANGKVVGVEWKNKHSHQAEWGYISKHPTLAAGGTIPVASPNAETSAEAAGTEIDWDSLSPREKFKLKKEGKAPPDASSATARTAAAEAVLGKGVQKIQNGTTQVGATTIIHDTSKATLPGKIETSNAALNVLQKTKVAPDKSWSNKRKAKFMRRHFGSKISLPKNLDDGLPYEQLLPNSAMRKNNLADLQDAIKAEAVALQQEEEAESESAGTAPGATAPPAQPRAVVAGEIPVIGPKLKELLIKEILPKMKLVDPDKDEISKKMDSWASQCGYDFMDILLWDLSSHKLFAEKGLPFASAMNSYGLCQYILQCDPELKAQLIADKIKPVAEEPITKVMTPREEYMAKKAAEKAGKAA